MDNSLQKCQNKIVSSMGPLSKLCMSIVDFSDSTTESQEVD